MHVGLWPQVVARASRHALASGLALDALLLALVPFESPLADHLFALILEHRDMPLPQMLFFLALDVRLLLLEALLDFPGLELQGALALLILHLFHLLSELLISFPLAPSDVLFPLGVHGGSGELLLYTHLPLSVPFLARPVPRGGYNSLVVLGAQHLGCLQVPDVIAILLVLLLSECLARGDVAVAPLLQLRLLPVFLRELLGLAHLAFLALLKRRLLPRRGLRLRLAVLLAEALDVIEHQHVAGVLFLHVRLRSLVVEPLPRLYLLVLLAQLLRTGHGALAQVLLLLFLLEALFLLYLLDLRLPELQVFLLSPFQPLFAFLDSLLALVVEPLLGVALLGHFSGVLLLFIVLPLPCVL
mmetsp:Transcript_30092/g.82670  ORF Transcript_30092/g.82670 Transcript_30092/m.82670 type:complete len:358 (+) Transcript_30092:154-1227(+)